jgi:acyl-CoA dehydrogenase
MARSIPIPFSEPPWLCGLPSPYYNDSHRRWQRACRQFIETNLLGNALEWEQNELVPEHVFKTFAEHNMLIPSLPAPLPVEWLKKLGVYDLLGAVKVEEFDYIHMLIYTDEV